MSFKENDFVFFNNKNIVIDKLYKKLNNKIFDILKIKVKNFFFIS